MRPTLSYLVVDGSIDTFLKGKQSTYSQNPTIPLREL